MKLIMAYNKLQEDSSGESPNKIVNTRSKLLFSEVFKSQETNKLETKRRSGSTRNHNVSKVLGRGRAGGAAGQTHRRWVGDLGAKRQRRQTSSGFAVYRSG